jgi:hypothetical protein
MKTATSLIVFVKAECANYYDGYQLCLLDDEPCDVLEGKRCAYFEKSVLGPPGYPFKQPGYDYAKLFAQYEDIRGTRYVGVRQRLCECGKPLQARQRFCAKCRKTRARSASRERTRKHRHSNSLDVTV